MNAISAELERAIEAKKPQVRGKLKEMILDTSDRVKRAYNELVTLQGEDPVVVEACLKERGVWELYSKTPLIPKTFLAAMPRAFPDKMVLAREFIEKHPLFYDEAGLFWIWNSTDKVYRTHDETDVLNSIHDAFSSNVASSKERSEILNALRQEGRRKKPQKMPPSWIQFKNGIIDIAQPGTFLEPGPEYFCVNPIPWEIGPSPETPIMDGVFKQWVGDQHITTLYEIIAYCLLPDYPLHRIFCLLGDGRNGKSKYLELIRKFVGPDNVCSTELDTLLNSRFEVTRLYKKLVCQMGETNFNELSRTAMLKKLSGGDLIGFEFKNKTPFEDTNYAKIIIATNSLPATSDKTDGFYRRWLLIDFIGKFTEKIDILGTIPEQEYKNLAFKCIGILTRLLQKREFTNEGTYEERQKRYEERSNPFDKFFKEFVEEDPDKFLTKHQFSVKLEKWCKENRYRVLSDRSINDKMKEKSIYEGTDRVEWYENEQKIKKQAKSWRGIKWKE